MRPATGKRRQYHHGRLRPALIESAVELIDERGIEALTLRQLARQVGVTHAAPYRHFRNKSALVTAVAQDGRHRLAERLSDAGRVDDAGGRPPCPLRAAARSYLQFALQHPGRYRVMFGPRVPSGGQRSEQHSETVCSALSAVLLDAQRRGTAGPGDPSSMALVLWCQLHGQASLLINGHIPGQPAAEPQALQQWIQTTVNLGLAGLRPT